ncbi:hypothetical protein TSUD_357190 [Trifolium subterraneum]|uniref:Uncharacterized protein n=1 Tax=Trifolium subterraneum TaxID=3900 RepID=A0A2Z6NCB2_TRISU|nr:hypothetical protein TSUD_357190 [Trifolium subterraneum]
MMSAVFQNVPVRKYRTDIHSYNYTSVDACQPGTSIPSLFQCRTSTDSSITITLLPERSNPMGFIYSVVLSQAGGNGMKKGESWIKCQCNLGEEGIKASELNTYVTELNSDHVYVWYDPYHCDSILKFYKPKICFEFCVTNDKGEVDGSIGIKECGVQLVSAEELESVLPELELDSKKKRELKMAVIFESGTIKGVGALDYSSCSNSDVEERSSLKGRQRKTTKPTKGFRRLVYVAKLRPSSSLKVSKIKSKSSGVRGSKENAKNSAEVVKSKGNKGTPVEPDDPLPELVGSQLDKANESMEKSKWEMLADYCNCFLTVVLQGAKGTLYGQSVEEDNESESHIFNVNESIIRSSNKETNTNAGTTHEENVTNSAKVFKSTGNEERPTQSEARLHLPVMPAVEENASGNRSSENNYDWQVNFDETKNSEEKSNIQGGQIIVPDTNDLISEPEQEKENAPKMNLSKPEGGSDVDPFAEIQSILFESPESSSKVTNAAVKEALHNLECLLENSLESILSDVELQRQLHTSLECIKQASHEKVSPNVVKLVQKMTSTIDNIFKDFVMTEKVVADHINILQQKENLVLLMGDAKKQKESKQTEKSQFEDEVKHLKEEGKKLDEKIRNLVEQKESNELKEINLKESMERCEGEKKKVEEKAKNIITEIKELMSKKEHVRFGMFSSDKKQRRNEEDEVCGEETEKKG